jgi:hypothetical protein
LCCCSCVLVPRCASLAPCQWTETTQMPSSCRSIGSASRHCGEGEALIRSLYYETGSLADRMGSKQPRCVFKANLLQHSALGCAAECAFGATLMHWCAVRSFPHFVDAYLHPLQGSGVYGCACLEQQGHVVLAAEIGVCSCIHLSFWLERAAPAHGFNRFKMLNACVKYQEWRWCNCAVSNMLPWQDNCKTPSGRQ